METIKIVEFCKRIDSLESLETLERELRLILSSDKVYFKMDKFIDKGKEPSHGSFEINQDIKGKPKKFKIDIYVKDGLWHAIYVNYIRGYKLSLSCCLDNNAYSFYGSITVSDFLYLIFPHLIVNSPKYFTSNIKDSLTNREKMVLELISLGHSNKKIADTLHISIPTVKFHVKNIYSKLGISSRVQASNLAYRVSKD